MFVSRKNNAPNVPQARPIEKFWAICKKEYKKLNKQVKTVDEMTKIWSKIPNKVAKKSGKSLMANVRRKIRLIGHEGVKSTF